MLLTLYGPDSYRRLHKLQEITKAYKAKYTGFSHARFDFENDEEFDKFQSFIKSTSLFDSVKLAILDNSLESSHKKDLKTSLKSIDNSKSITVIINEAKKPQASFKFLLDKPNQAQEFPALKGEALKAFIKTAAAEDKLQIDSSVISYMIDTFESNTWGITTELKRMAFSNNKTVNTERAIDFFPLINVLKSGYNTKQRLVALEKLLSERKDDPARVFNTIAFRPKSGKEAEKLADYDIAIKSGTLEYEEVLLSFALGL